MTRIRAFSLALLPVALALGAFVPVTAGGLAEQEISDCEEPMSQGEMNHCAALDFRQADVELNVTWTEAIAQARDFDRYIPEWDERPSAERRLREAQRAWIIFRDAHCAVRGYEARGGSMEAMLYDGCRAQITRDRAEQLRSLFLER